MPSCVFFFLCMFKTKKILYLSHIEGPKALSCKKKQTVCRQNGVRILSIVTDRYVQTLQSDHGQHCLPFHRHLLDALRCCCKTKLFCFTVLQIRRVTEIIKG